MPTGSQHPKYLVYRLFKIVNVMERRTRRNQIKCLVRKRQKLSISQYSGKWMFAQKPMRNIQPHVEPRVKFFIQAQPQCAAAAAHFQYAAVRDIRRIAPEVPVILITAFGTLEGAVAAMREGAYDYRSKPFEIDDLMLTVRRALEASGLRDEVRALREETRRASVGPELVAGPGVRSSPRT